MSFIFKAWPTQLWWWRGWWWWLEGVEQQGGSKSKIHSLGQQAGNPGRS